MGALPKPRVPDPSTQVLFDALHQLHHRAGWPSLRDMSREVGCSHTTISAAFSEPRIPRWGLLELIVETLNGDTEEFHQLWLAAGRTRLSPEPPGAAPKPSLMPRDLPADVAGFTGRQPQLADLDDLLDGARGRSSAVSIATLSGTAGVGKTALAVHWAHRVAEQFPDGQLYLNLRGYDPGEPLQPAEALESLLRELGMDGGAVPHELAQRAARFRTMSAGRKLLILLDNARSVDQVRDLLPGDSSCFVVVTSRDALPALVARHGARRINLDLLPSSDSIQLLCTLIGARAEAEPDAAAALAEHSARLPLALRIVAELAISREGTPLVELVDELDDEARRLDLLAAGDDEHTAVRAVFSWSQRQLDPATAAAFAQLGLHPGPEIDIAAAAALLDATPQQARRLLGSLVRANLLDVRSADSFGMHDLLRAYAAELAAERPDRAATLVRMFDHYVQAAAEPRRDVQRVTLTAVARAAAVGWPQHTIGIAVALADYLDIHAYYSEALTLDELALDAARRSEDREAEATVLNLLGVAHRRFGRYRSAETLHEQALALHRELGSTIGEAHALHGLGILAWRSGRFVEARQRLGEALGMYREVADRVGEGHALYVLGIAELKLGEHADSLVHQQAAVQINREIGERTGEGRALNNLGEVLLRLGRFDEAAEAYRAALTIAREQGNRTGEAVALTNLATIDQRQGEFENALETYGQALTICRDVGYRIGEADALRGSGVVYRCLGWYADGSEQLDQAVSIAREVGEADVETCALNDLGDTLAAAGRTMQASASYLSAGAVAQRTGDRYEQARSWLGLAELARDTDPQQAREYRRQAMAGFAALGLAGIDRTHTAAGPR